MTSTPLKQKLGVSKHENELMENYWRLFDGAVGQLDKTTYVC